MGKKQEKKTAKGRLDKFYWLAKEQGYRSRAAFKLVQLNKKFNFLEKARCCIDLCAAPGGWLQVASKYMPANSLIVGVDLVPIKPIPRTITFAEDINSYKCRDQLRQILKDWKADVVIHDGAPNVGTAWVQDAYAQSELTLQSLRLAVEFLTAGGTFVTKVFRSKDYNNLLWVFNQLFKKVEATKPASSRNVSAEIFVVCQGYKNPARIDPRFLDPTHVFKELDPNALDQEQEAGVPLSLKGTSAGNAHANVFEPKKIRRNREGYADGDYTLFHSLDAIDFIKGQDVVGMLGSYNEISFKKEESRNLLKLEETTEEITHNCSDLKVLGKKDFRNLMNWRKDVRIILGLDLSKAAQKDLAEQTETVEVEEMDEDEMIDDELARLNEEAARKARKERRRRNEIRQKKILKMQLQMTTPMEIGMDVMDDQLQSGNDDFFDIGTGEKVSRKATLDEAAIDDDDSETVVGSIETDDEDDPQARAAKLDAEMDALYDEYRQKQSDRDAKFRAREARRKDSKMDSWHGIKDDDEDDDDAAEQSDESEGGYDLVVRRKEQEETFDTDDEEDEEDERAERHSSPQYNHPGNKRKRGSFSRPEEQDDDEDGLPAKPAKKSSLIRTLVSDEALAAQQSREASIWFDNPLFKDLAPALDGQDPEDEEDEEDEQDADEGLAESDEEDEDDERLEEEDESEEDDFEVVPQNQEEGSIPDQEWDVDGEDEEAGKQKRIQDHGLATAEAVALAQALVNRQVTKEDLMDQGFSKHNFVDKNGLPEWFLDDEQKHYKANIPITKEAMQALRDRQRALDARPIKKVAEAKARKKMRALQRLEKAQKKAENINENDDISEKEKASTINKLLAKSMKGGKQKKEVQLVVAKGVNRGLKGRPKGTKGRYKMVDPRMKKELRAVKRKNKREGKKVGSSNTKSRTPKGYGPRN